MLRKPKKRFPLHTIPPAEEIRSRVFRWGITSRVEDHAIKQFITGYKQGFSDRLENKSPSWTARSCRASLNFEKGGYVEGYKEAANRQNVLRTVSNPR